MMTSSSREWWTKETKETKDDVHDVHDVHNEAVAAAAAAKRNAQGDETADAHFRKGLNAAKNHQRSAGGIRDGAGTVSGTREATRKTLENAGKER